LTKARRDSTNIIIQALVQELRTTTDGEAPLNLSQIARQTGFHRKTVARALAFALSVGIIAYVAQGKTKSPLRGTQPGVPSIYRLNQKLLNPRRAPSPSHSPYKRKMSFYEDGRRPTQAMRRWAMSTIRRRLPHHLPPSVVAAFGKYVFSEHASKEGIRHVVNTCRNIIPQNAHELTERQLFAAVRARIRERTHGYDQVMHTIAEKRDCIPLSGVADFLRRREMANGVSYVTSSLSALEFDHLHDCNPLPRLYSIRSIFPTSTPQEDPHPRDASRRLTDFGDSGTTHIIGRIDTRTSGPPDRWMNATAAPPAAAALVVDRRGTCDPTDDIDRRPHDDDGRATARGLRSPRALRALRARALSRAPAPAAQGAARSRVMRDVMDELRDVRRRDPRLARAVAIALSASPTPPWSDTRTLVSQWLNQQTTEQAQPRSLGPPLDP